MGADESIVCWGYGSGGQLGDGTTAVLSPQRVALPGAAGVVTAGDTHACATVSGAVYCWGNNNDSQLGVPVAALASAQPLPQLVPSIVADNLVAGANHTCAQISTSSVSCFGANLAGQLGTGGPDPTGVGSG